MAQQIIDVGATANDGTGEPLRQAFDAVNNNFSQIFAAGPVDSNVVIANNTISINGINGNLILQANGIGNVVFNSSMRPSIDSVFNIGDANYRVNTIHSQYFVGNGSQLTGVVAAAAPYIANGTSNIAVNASNATVTIQGTSDTVVFNRFNTTFKGNLLPAANVTYNLGSATAAWKDLYLSGNTLYLNNSTITSNATAVTITNQQGGTFVLSGNGAYSGTSNAIVNGTTNMTAAANGNISATIGGTSNVLVVTPTGINVSTVSATGNVTGNYILGNGSQLTGLPATYGNANVQAYLPTYTGNLVSLTGPVTTSGNITGAYIIGNGSQLTGLPAQ